MQGFAKDLDKRAWDLDDAANRLDTTKSNEIELFGATMIDLFETDALLQPNVSLKITYTRTKPHFYLLTDATTRTNNYIFEIRKIGLQVLFV